MGEFQPLIEKLGDDRMTSFEADDMGVLHLRDVVSLLRVVRSELELSEDLNRDEITTNVRSALLSGSFASQLDALLNEMAQYGERTQNPSEQRDRFRGIAEGLRDVAVERLRPLRRTNEALVQARMDEVRDLIEELKAAKAELASQQSALAQSSASEASGELATFYTTQAEGHAGSARTFFWGGVVSAALLTVATAGFFFWSPPDYESTRTSEQWIEVARETVGRLALISIAGFIVAFCVRNYRVNMHLEVLNKRRENALNTFGLLQASVTSEDARNIVVSELVSAVFTSEETGHLSAQTERTVIESPGGAGLIQAMSSMARGPSQ